MDDFEQYEALLRRAGVRRSPQGSLVFDPGALRRPRGTCRGAHAARLHSSGDSLLG